MDRLRGEVNEASTKLDGLRAQRRDVKDQIAQVDKERKALASSVSHAAPAAVVAAAAVLPTASMEEINKSLFLFVCLFVCLQ